jgi:hypothetical protein
MRYYLLLAIFIFNCYSLSAQCPDYQSELQNVESYISTAIKDLKKAEKASALEEAQKFIDKAVTQAEFAEKSANLAKEYAISCSCSEGISSATLIITVAFDCRAQAHKAADFDKLGELKDLLGKSLIAARSVLDETSNGLSYCLGDSIR